MNEENKAVIKALNMYGRVPEQYELLEEIERLKIIEEKYKDSQLYIHDFKEEIERLNNIIKNQQEDIEEYNDKLNEVVKERNKYLHIINELERYINKTKLEGFEKEYGRRYGKTFTQAEVIICNMILNKLQELKGSNKE